MKEKKNEEVKEVIVEKVYTKNEIITKERVISIVIGIFIGALITSAIFCICMKTHRPKAYDNPRIQTQERNVPKYGKRYRYQYREPSTNNTDETQKSDNTTTQSNN